MPKAPLWNRCPRQISMPRSRRTPSNNDGETPPMMRDIPHRGQYAHASSRVQRAEFNPYASSILAAK